MKILLDHNLDRRLKQYLTDYDTATTQEQGWTGQMPSTVNRFSAEQIS